MEIILGFLVLHWYGSLFSQSFFLHRYSAHRMYELSPFWENVFYWFTFITQGSSFLSPRAYGIMHNEHHRYSDTEKDPHSPHFFTNPLAMMLHTKDRYSYILNSDDPKYHDGQVTHPFLDEFGDHWGTRVAWGTLYSLVYIAFAPSIYWFAMLPVHFLMGPIHGAIVNWCGHKNGYRNFDLPDKSKNTLPVDFLLMGELYQNNHHKNGKAPNFAVKWWEIDPTYPFMIVFHYVGIIKLKSKTAPDVDKLIADLRSIGRENWTSLSKKYRENLKLTNKLWASKKVEVQEFILSYMDESKLSGRKMDAWSKQVANEKTAELFVSKVVSFSPERDRKLRKWIQSRNISRKLCGYKLLKTQAQSHYKNGKVDWENYLIEISKSFQSSTESVKNSMKEAYVAISRINEDLKNKAIKLASTEALLAT